MSRMFPKEPLEEVMKLSREDWIELVESVFGAVMLFGGFIAVYIAI